MSSGFFNISDLLKGGLERVGLKGAVRERVALEIWAEVVGPKTASVTRPEQIRDGIIYVNCRDSMWSQQLHFLRPLIIEKLNERLGEKIVKEIRLSGKGFQRSSRKEEDPLAVKGKGSLPELSDSDIRHIEQASSCIEDPELAERVKKALQASKALRKRFEDRG